MKRLTSVFITFAILFCLVDPAPSTLGSMAVQMQKNLSLCALQLLPRHETNYLSILNRTFDPSGPFMAEARAEFAKLEKPADVTLDIFVDAIHRGFWTRVYQPYARKRSELRRQYEQAGFTDAEIEARITPELNVITTAAEASFPTHFREAMAAAKEYVKGN